MQPPETGSGRPGLLTSWPARRAHGRGRVAQMDPRRGKELVVYLSTENPAQVELLAKLGKHKMGKACLYFKRLADLDATVLEALIAGSVAEVQRRYPNTADA